MFSQGQLAFAIIFFISFVTILVFSYRKDFKGNKTYYKGSYKILIVFISLDFTFFNKNINSNKLILNHFYFETINTGFFRWRFWKYC